MGRRRKRKQNIPAVFPAILLLAIAVIFLINLLSKVTAGTVDSFIFAIGILFAAIGYFYHRVKAALSSKIGQIVSAHIEILVRRRAQLLLTDAYGTPQTDSWHKEINHFLEGKVVPKLTSRECKLLIRRKAAWVRVIDDMAGRAAIDNSPFGDFSAVTNPNDFEIFCAEELKRVGWEASVTKKSRDQGVDVIAQKDGFRLVLQCKLYSQPVGNAAVQQIATARTHERAHFGAVVSNNKYTVPAQQLANTSRIALLHFSDLKKIDDIICRTAR